MSTFFNRFRHSCSKSRGFTLIELMVVVGIMVLITTVILVRQSRFDSSTLLRSLSYSVALTVRSAQVYGISVRGTQTPQSNCAAGTFANGTCYAPAYGVYFNNANSYLLFADNNGNGVYDAAVDTVIQTYQLGSGFHISKFCGKLASGGMHCSNDAAPITWLVIYFKRPQPDALFSSSAAETYSGAYIQVAAINDPSNTHSISVSITGQISVGVAGS